MGKQTAVMMLVVTAFFWSTSGILIKLVNLPPLAIAGWRSLIAGVTVLVLCRSSIRVSWDKNTLAAAACMGLFSICFVGATKLGVAANAIVLQYAASAYVAVLAPRLLGEPTSLRDWFSLIFVVAGIGLFFYDALALDSVFSLVLGIAGSVFWAGTVIFLRRVREQSTAWPIVLGSFMAAGLCLPFMFSQSPSPLDWAGLFGLGIVSLGLGYAVYSVAIRYVTALEGVLICSVEPLINPLWVFLGTAELPGPMALTGAGLVLAAVTVRGILAAKDQGKKYYSIDQGELFVENFDQVTSSGNGK